VNTEVDLNVAKTAATQNSRADWFFHHASATVIHCVIGVKMLFTGRLDCGLQALLYCRVWRLGNSQLV